MTSRYGEPERRPTSSYRPPGIGDVLEWQGCPVLVIGNVRQDGTAPCVYLRVRPPIQATALTEVKPMFKVEGKELWTDELTDAEQVAIMRLLLIGVSNDR